VAPSPPSLLETLAFLSLLAVAAAVAGLEVVAAPAA